MSGTIVLPEQEVFNARVSAIQSRIEAISGQNRMAKLLNDNFRNWLANSSMSPLNLTLELDKDSNGLISGDEFAGLLGKMTGERPPDWVIELVFSFVQAKPETGIPLADWMAFMAANGLEVPEHLFAKKVEITGSIHTTAEEFVVNDEITVTVSFSDDVDGYSIKATESNSGQVEEFFTPLAEMDSPTGDQFMLQPDEEGLYQVELLHLGIRLSMVEMNILQPVEEEQEEVEPEVATYSEHEEEAHEEILVVDEGLGGFITELNNTKLKSEARALIEKSSAYRINGLIKSTATTLLGDGDHRNGTTVACDIGDGFVLEVMMKHGERLFEAGQPASIHAAPHDWSVATRRLICKEL